MTSLPQHATYFLLDGDADPSLLFLHLNYNSVSNHGGHYCCTGVLLLVR